MTEVLLKLNASLFRSPVEKLRTTLFKSVFLSASPKMDFDLKGLRFPLD